MASQLASPVQAKAVAVEMPSHATRVEYFESWELETRTVQRLARRDREYYDNNQWTREEIAKLKERRQPILTKNHIAKKVNFILGHEIMQRVDPVARPRTPVSQDASRSATDALRYVEEQQKFDSVRSKVAKNVLIEGYGGAIKELEDEGSGEIKHRLRHIQWDRLFYDPKSRDPLFSDAKYLGIVQWMDLDDAILEYPDKAKELAHAVANDPQQSGSSETTDDIASRWVDGKRKRVKIVELYFRIGPNWFRSNYTQAVDLIEPEPTGYLSERGDRHVCPLKMVSCYVAQDGTRHGVVRQWISPQDEINKRSSKALHRLNTKGPVIAEEDSIPDPQNFRTELSKPDGLALVRQGAIQDGSIQVLDDTELAQGQVALHEQAKRDIDDIGPSSAQIPDLPQSASGKAIMARGQASSQEMRPVFDAIREWTMGIWELDWLCIRQAWTEEMWLRVTDDRELSGYRFVDLNRRMSRAERFQEILQQQSDKNIDVALQVAAGQVAPIVLAQSQQQLAEMQQQAQVAMQQAQQRQQQLAAQAAAQGAEMAAQQVAQPLEPPQLPDLPQIIAAHPLMRQEVVKNQVSQMLVDIILDDAPETAVVQQEEFQKLANIMPSVTQQRPDLSEKMLELTIRASSLRDKKEILEALQEPPNPQAQQMQQAQVMAQLKQIEASIAQMQSTAQLNQAKAVSEQAEAQGKVVEAQLAAERADAEITETHAKAAKAATEADATARQTLEAFENGISQTTPVQTRPQTRP